MDPKGMYTELSNSEIKLWIEQGELICIKAITLHDDPVELACHEAKILADTLLKMVADIERRGDNQ